MPNHFIHYLKREIKIGFSKKPDDSKDQSFYGVQDFEDGFERPMYHITRRNTGPTKRIEEDDIIWLFSTLQSPWGMLPSALDAMIVVGKIEEEDGRTKFLAKDDSSWFPFADATQIIRNLKTIDKNGNTQKLQVDEQKPLGLYLQSIRQLYDAEELTQWSKTILEAEVNFISYRIKDGTKPAFQKVKNLVQAGKVVFWDRFSLPRRLVERREEVSDEKLDKYLMKNLINSSCVWGIESPLYSFSESYSLKESQLAKEQGKYNSVTYFKESYLSF